MVFFYTHCIDQHPQQPFVFFSSQRKHEFTREQSVLEEGVLGSCKLETWKFMLMGTNPDTEFGTCRSLLVIWHPYINPKNFKLCLMHAAHRVCRSCILGKIMQRYMCWGRKQGG